METYLPITYLNDFVFCPYSIYLHQVFDNNTEEVYSAIPQQRGKAAHSEIDSFEKERTVRPKSLKGIYVISNRLRVYGKIDTYFIQEKKLVESKFHIKTIYRGYYYQIWSHYFGLMEMGYPVQELAFYSIKDQKNYPIPIPSLHDIRELQEHIRAIAHFDFDAPLTVNPQKCSHCIYAALCDKTGGDHVYA
jgi:CRISPR-associated protein Cas4